jgi:hypothetical protein
MLTNDDLDVVGLGVYSASNRNKYQIQKYKMFLGNRAQSVREAHNLTTICEPTVYMIWDPQHLSILYAFTACYGDSFTYFTHSRGNA